MIINSEKQDDVEAPAEFREIINGAIRNDFDLRIQYFLRQIDAGRTAPVLGEVVERDDLGRAALLRVEAPAPVPATDIEDTLAGKINQIEFILDETS